MNLSSAPLNGGWFITGLLTDPLAEKVRFVDDEIGTFSKAFLGVTVSCRPVAITISLILISQADYYALFGILGSVRRAGSRSIRRKS